MPNKNYIKGRRKEYSTRSILIQQGWDIVQRTAGSHSPIDLIAINIKERKIRLIQCKPDSMSNKNKIKIETDNKQLNGLYMISFIVI